MNAKQAQQVSLIRQKRSKFQEIVRSIKQTLGASTTTVGHDDLEAEAENALEEWAEADCDCRLPARDQMTPLQILLAEYLELENQFLDIEDSAIARGNAK